MKNFLYGCLMVVCIVSLPPLAEISFHLGRATRDYLNSKGIEHEGFYDNWSIDFNDQAITHPIDGRCPYCKEQGFLEAPAPVCSDRQEVRGLPEPSDVRGPLPELLREDAEPRDEGLLREPPQGGLPGVRGGDHPDEDDQPEVANADEIAVLEGLYRAEKVRLDKLPKPDYDKSPKAFYDHYRELHRLRQRISDLRGDELIFGNG